VDQADNLLALCGTHGHDD
jgi:hypothetical protein